MIVGTITDFRIEVDHDDLHFYYGADGERTRSRRPLERILTISMTVDEAHGRQPQIGQRIGVVGEGENMPDVERFTQQIRALEAERNELRNRLAAAITARPGVVIDPFVGSAFARALEVPRRPRIEDLVDVTITTVPNDRSAQELARVVQRTIDSALVPPAPIVGVPKEDPKPEVDPLDTFPGRVAKLEID